jgi:hypothetical protein
MMFGALLKRDCSIDRREMEIVPAAVNAVTIKRGRHHGIGEHTRPGCNCPASTPDKPFGDEAGDILRRDLRDESDRLVSSAFEPTDACARRGRRAPHPRRMGSPNFRFSARSSEMGRPRLRKRILTGWSSGRGRAGSTLTRLSYSVWPALTISAKLRTSRLAPPTKAPSISGWLSSSLALAGLTLPPY